MDDIVRIAGVQIEPQLMKTEENLGKVINGITTAATSHAQLIVFPECSLTGYIFSSRQEALQYAETVPGPSTEAVASLCRELNVYVVFGLLEKEGNKLFNAAPFAGPNGLIGNYRKVHLPYVGVDRFVDPGDKPFQVYKTPIANIGIQICRDLVLPEGSRVLTLMGADILVVPTNYSPLPWGGLGEKFSDCFIPTRTMENRVHMIAVDRIGTERGCTFVGSSRIVNALGQTLARSNCYREEIIYGQVSLAMARQKHVVTVPGEWEVDILEGRRPEFYREIAKPKSSQSLDNVGG